MHILSYVVGHDSGNVINPMIVDGQVQGGVAHGIGNALFEFMRYDADAQPLTTSFADYLMPTAPEVPGCAIEHVETPNPLNPLGVKGAGEGGTIPAPAAIIVGDRGCARAVRRAFREMPLTPARIVAALPRRRRLREPGPAMRLTAVIASEAESIARRDPCIRGRDRHRFARNDAKENIDHDHHHIEPRRRGRRPSRIDNAAQGNLLTVEDVRELAAAFRAAGATDAKVIVLRTATAPTSAAAARPAARRRRPR